MKKKFLLVTCLIGYFFDLNAQVKINEVYGGGGNSSASYQNDFVELYNISSSPVTLTNWSIQYTSATGTGWGSNKTTFSGTIPANGYFLIKLASGGVNGALLPTQDASGITNMSSSAGKIVLCNNNTNVSAVANPTDANIIDKVGYGSTASGFEGTGPAPGISNSTSAQRTSPGADADNNSVDFIEDSPTPVNTSGPDLITPTVSSFIPANNAINVTTNSELSITFSEAIFANKGFIKINNTSTNSFDLVDVKSPNVNFNGTIVKIYGANLQPNNNYNIIIADTCFKDAGNNKYAGTTAIDWSFTTNAIATASINGIVGNIYNLNNIANVFGSDGFKQFSIEGGLTWAITNFGRSTTSAKASAPSGIQLNGFDNAINSNVSNIDWFISPKFDLSSTNFPLLSFYSRTKFNGAPLELKVSTDYPGFGNPNNFNWTTINGRFPGATSDSFVLSNNINLSAFKTTSTYFALVYTSTNDEGARWTVDDILVTNSPIAPPPTLTLGTSDIQFGYVAQGGSIVKKFPLTGNDIANDITLTVAGNDFELSKDGTTFSNSITFTTAEVNNVTKTVFVRFIPSLADKNFNSSITVSSGALNSIVGLKGTSIDVVKTLEVVNWNLEWFGSTINGPTNDNQQESNIKTILQNLNADLFGLVEVVNETRLSNVVNSMPGYTYQLGNFGSHINPADPIQSTEAQKLAFVYKTAVFSNVSFSVPLSVGVNTAADLAAGSAFTNYNNWASGRFPYMMTADVTLGGETKTIRFVLVHAKANTAPTLTSYNRRRDGADSLRKWLNDNYPNDNIVMLGDFNDDLDSTITDGIFPKTSSYFSFMNDPATFTSPTLALSLTGKASTVSYNDIIDHVLVSNEMKNYYITGSSTVLTDVSTLVSNYGSTTSDHYPVFSRYAFSSAILPVRLTDFTAIKKNGTVSLQWKTASEISSKEYIIERSSDGIQYKAIGTVLANNNNIGATYSFADNTPSVFNYYRLRIIDQNEKFNYSKIILVVFENTTKLTIAPNPAREFITIRNNTQSKQLLQLINSNGQTVLQQHTSASNTIVPLKNLPIGLYYIKLSANKKVITQKLLIQ